MPTPIAVTPSEIHPHALVFRAVEKILKSNPRLNQTVKTWRSWTGDTKDLQPLEASGAAPAIELNPHSTASGWLDPARHEEDFIVQVRIMIAGTRYEDGVNLWRLCELAMCNTTPGSNPNQQLLQAAGVRGGTFTIQQPAMQLLRSQDQDSAFTTFIGAFKFRVVVNTPQN